MFALKNRPFSKNVDICIDSDWFLPMGTHVHSHPLIFTRQRNPPTPYDVPMFLRPNFSSSWKDIQRYYSFWFISSRGDRTGWHRSSRRTRRQWIWFAPASQMGPLDIIPLTPLNILSWILFLPHFTGKETKLQKTTVTKMTQLVSGKRKPSGPPTPLLDLPSLYPHHPMTVPHNRSSWLWRPNLCVMSMDVLSQS